MTPKEVKAALADENVIAAIEKRVAAAVKAETKRCINEAKAIVVPEDASAEVKTAVKSIVKTIVDSIKN